MRASEFIIENFADIEILDVELIQATELAIFLESNKELFETTENYVKLKKFLDEYNTATPRLNDKFSAAGILFVPNMNYINVVSLNKSKLVKIQNNVLYFLHDGKIKRFPEGDLSTDSVLKKTVLFDNNTKLNHFLTLLNLKFSDWKISYKQLGENFADGKKPGRKGLAKRSGVNCKASVTSLRKTAKSSSGEKRRMAHWCANMKSGKKNK